jgi:phospholipase C
MTSAFDFASPNDPVFPPLPDTKRYRQVETQQATMPAAIAPAKPSLFAQHRGTRPARATPYELHVDAAVGAEGKVSLVFRNTGRQGAVFHVYDRRHLDRIPRRYTVEAGKQLADDWDTMASDRGGYNLWVYGPNGFVRTFEGNAQPGRPGDRVGIRLGYDGARGAVRLEIVNRADVPQSLAVSANAYRRDGPWTLTIEPGTELKRTWELSESGNWYDFSVIGEQGFRRRFAGRVETGHSGVSDPAMGAATT